MPVTNMVVLLVLFIGGFPTIIWFIYWALKSEDPPEVRVPTIWSPKGGDTNDSSEWVPYSSFEYRYPPRRPRRQPARLCSEPKIIHRKKLERG